MSIIPKINHFIKGLFMKKPKRIVVIKNDTTILNGNNISVQIEQYLWPKYCGLKSPQFSIVNTSNGATLSLSSRNLTRAELLKQGDIYTAINSAIVSILTKI